VWQPIFITQFLTNRLGVALKGKGSDRKVVITVRPEHLAGFKVRLRDREGEGMRKGWERRL